MSSRSACHSCIRALQHAGRQTRTITSNSRRITIPKSTIRHRQSSTQAASAYSNQPESYEITGKSPSLKVKPDGKSDISRLLVQKDDLFHSFSESPIPSMRQRAAFMRAHAYCPHPAHNRTRTATSEVDPESRKPVSGGLAPAHVNFECPHCGVPVSCSEEHWAEDYDEHIKICDTLREINEDDHDIRSGRAFPEFQYVPEGIEEAVINFTNWDTLLYTREFTAVDEMRSLRQVTRLLTYPITIGSVLHELSPYSLRDDGRLTPEGLRSLAGKHPITNHHTIN